MKATLNFLNCPNAYGKLIIGIYQHNYYYCCFIKGLGITFYSNVFLIQAIFTPGLVTNKSQEQGGSLLH